MDNQKRVRCTADYKAPTARLLLRPFGKEAELGEVLGLAAVLKWRRGTDGIALNAASWDIPGIG